MEIVEHTASYTATASDSGKDIWVTSASDEVLTIPAQQDASFPDKTYFFVTRGGTGALTLAGAAGVTVHACGGRLGVAEQYGTVLVRKTAADTWLVTGNLSS